jgi:ATP-binding cassette subfamily B protein
VDIERLAWRQMQLGDMLEALGQKGGLYPRLAELPAMPEVLRGADTEALGNWLDAAAASLGMEAEAVESRYMEVEQLIRAGAPAILRIPQAITEEEQEGRYIGLLKGGERSVMLLCPDLTTKRQTVQELQNLLCRDVEEPYQGMVTEILEEAGVSEERRERVRRAILAEQLANLRVGEGWLLRISPGASIWNHIRHGRLYRPFFGMLGAQIIQQVLSIFAWWMIGLGVFQGHFDLGWLAAWGLVLFSTIPFQIMSVQAQNELSIGAGSLFKQRLLYGVLRLDPQEIRHQGAGQFLGRVMESAAVEMLTINGGLIALMAFVQWASAIWVLGHGVGGWIHVGLGLAWLVVFILTSWLFVRRNLAWAGTYRDMTNDLVERMVGHRTRLAQQEPERWHEEEDAVLAKYFNLTVKQAQINLQLSFIPRGWVLLGIAGITLPLVAFPQSAPLLAVSLGGIMLAYQAFQTMSLGVESMAGLLVAAEQIRPIYQAAARPPESQPMALPAAIGEVQTATAPPEVILWGRDLDFRYRPAGRQVLRGCTLEVRRGDRILLEGPSGGGKSTLASLLSGLRSPEAGLLLLHGYDQQTMGKEEWRRRVVVAPQFQENHVFTGTFAFNLLMGRRWPPYPSDLQEAEEICRELGLGELIDRMPARFQQMVGESGWQLSHGERSRLFIARALLQNADVIILDESFGALDPENLRRALRCVLERAKTIMVIAHP